MDNDEEIQIQNQYSTYNNTPVGHIKNDDEIEQKDMIVELEEYDAVVTVLAFFNYFQCQTLKDAGSIAGKNVSRNIKGPLNTSTGWTKRRS